MSVPATAALDRANAELAARQAETEAVVRAQGARRQAMLAAILAAVPEAGRAAQAAHAAHQAAQTALAEARRDLASYEQAALTAADVDEASLELARRIQKVRLLEGRATQAAEAAQAAGAELRRAALQERARQVAELEGQIAAAQAETNRRVVELEAQARELESAHRAWAAPLTARVAELERLTL